MRIDRAALKAAALRGLSRAIGRPLVVLGAEANPRRSILGLSAPYRVEGEELRVALRERRAGRLRATLLGYDGFFPRTALWAGEPRDYVGPSELVFALETGDVTLGGAPWGRVTRPLPGRRFCWSFELTTPSGETLQRLTGHYRAGRAGAPGSDYYTGDTYIDHEAQSQGEHDAAVRLLREHRALRRVLEVGCATGGLLEALDAEGGSSFGLDVSAWAIERARARLGDGRAWRCDVESEPLPAEVLSKAPFSAVVLWAVLEHFATPYAVLERIGSLVEPGGVMIINTTNADSLTHTLFGRDWEGFFDATHKSVDQVSARTLEERLTSLGWSIELLRTSTVWDGCADPTRATLREWWAADARFRRLLEERHLGDLLVVVARR